MKVQRFLAVKITTLGAIGSENRLLVVARSRALSHVLVVHKGQHESDGKVDKAHCGQEL